MRGQISVDPITNLHSMLCILIEVLLRAQKGVSEFKFGTSISRFQSDGAARMAVKGLTEEEKEERRGVDIKMLLKSGRQAYTVKTSTEMCRYNRYKFM